MTLHPSHYLASRIFLWFWLVILATVAGTLLISKGVPEKTEIRRLPPAVQQQLQGIANRYAEANSVEQLLQRLDNRRQGRWLLVDPVGQRVLNPAGLPAQFDHNWLTELSQLEQARLLRHSNLYLAGPFPVQVDGHSLALYQQRQRPVQPWWNVSALPQHVLLISLFLFSAVASLILAVSITRPLRELLHSYATFASGQLDHRLQRLASRRDELGALGRGFNAMADRIHSLLQGQQRLLRDVSHELRSPLTRAQLALALEARQGQGQQLPRLQQELEQVDQLLEELLTYSRLHSGHYPFEPETFDIIDFSKQLFATNQVEADAKQQVMHLEAEPSCLVYADKRLLSRALENVLRNAIKYSPVQSQIHCEIVSTVQGVQIRFCDQGPGVPKEQLDAIFNPFYRVCDSRTADSGGTGLGLAIAAESIRHHQGTIEASANTPTGLCINMWLPTNSPETAQKGNTQ
ncbi:ATP-binding protein [Alkalimonas collagenimarina]|uniref:histidine kinase n=1 Tax=Alkalimonas collagenimarina TaxID=400390 RepID=A0ABT9GVI4_9GAMM|nr:ATP-binding protein [Alkalimonas collagenimarina]MDP4535057.1 ATP-binding protein [Alkalimonas collagenimarina]